MANTVFIVVDSIVTICKHAGVVVAIVVAVVNDLIDIVIAVTSQI